MTIRCYAVNRHGFTTSAASDDVCVNQRPPKMQHCYLYCLSDCVVSVWTTWTSCSKVRFKLFGSLMRKFDPSLTVHCARKKIVFKSLIIQLLVWQELALIQIDYKVHQCFETFASESYCFWKISMFFNCIICIFMRHLMFEKNE